MNSILITLEPIGTFHTDSKFPYEARRQASADTANTRGEIRLRPGQNFEQALEDLEGFERIWIVYQFHHNSEWKPKVMPPRGPRIKRGVFATRAPYRPSSLGLSCVRLVKVEGLSVIVEAHDLLDGTPVLDIKPYLPYADAFPESKVGWLENVESTRWQVDFTPQAKDQIHWLEEKGVPQLSGFIQAQLEFEPLDNKRKRVEIQGEDKTLMGLLSYRTWRIKFTAEQESHQISIHSVHSGYTKEDLVRFEDIYDDKDLHRRFLEIKW